MAWRSTVVALLALLVVAAAARGAAANGRPPATSSITFREGHENEIIAGLTFGLIFSRDNGQSWEWMCENAIGYTGIYDPRYAFSNTGALFATTFDGLKVVRDRCTFNPMPSGVSFTSATATGPDGAFYFALAQTADAQKQLPADFKIYKSTDDGVTFPISAKPGRADDTNVWWETLMVAPSNAQRLYVTGYSYMAVEPGGEAVRTQLLFRSDDGAVSWQAMSTTGLEPMTPDSVIQLVGITSDDPSHLYVRVKNIDAGEGEAIYVSTNAGESWALINRKEDPIAGFVVRRAKNSQGKHDLVIGTKVLGAEVSHDDGKTWTALADAPHIGCLAESSAGEIWACTQNYGDRFVLSDMAGLMKTTDLVTWTRVLRYQDLSEAVTCPAGTLQKDLCAEMWCALCVQLGCTPSAAYGCPMPVEAVPPPPPPPPTSGGCCDAGAAGG
ncbi:MAG: hypothetical protein H7138_06290, partial [Myxococcales bacterium]|nr:hypothetical protein [Myxococcales bacterium]